MFSEFVATMGLLCVVWGCVRVRSSAVPFAVGAYITAAYWFTVSTSFANPAVTVARAVTNTFAGIRPAHVPAFIVLRWRAPSLRPDFFVGLFRRCRVKHPPFLCGTRRAEHKYAMLHHRVLFGRSQKWLQVHFNRFCVFKSDNLLSEYSFAIVKQRGWQTSNASEFLRQVICRNG